MKKNIILFDIDKTISSPSDKLEKFENQLIGINEVKKGDILNIYNKYVESMESSTDFEPSDFMKFISNKTNISFEYLKQKFYDPVVWKETIYPEVMETLEKLKKKKNILGIYSEGFDSYQMAKLRLVGVENFFDKNFIFIGRRKQSDDFIKKLPDKATIVDDKKEVVEKLKTLNRFKVIWINRINDEKIQGIKTIKSLLEITE